MAQCKYCPPNLVFENCFPKENKSSSCNKVKKATISMMRTLFSKQNALQVAVSENREKIPIESTDLQKKGYMHGG